jgi:hypothetical protein
MLLYVARVVAMWVVCLVVYAIGHWVGRLDEREERVRRNG